MTASTTYYNIAFSLANRMAAEMTYTQYSAKMWDFCCGFSETAALRECCSSLYCCKDSQNFCNTFTAKERDEETGYNYHGARYYDAGLLTGWLSVDPLADKYPGISPYAYCAWNPVKLVDPDGRDWYDLYKDGTLVRNEEKSKEYQNSDVIYSQESKKLSKEYALGTIGSVKHNDEMSYDVKNGDEITHKTARGQRFTIFGDANTANEIFEFCASNAPFVEYSLIESDDEMSYLTTSHDRKGDDYGTAWGLSLAMKGKFLSHTHNHPGKSSEFSGGDINFYNCVTKYVQDAAGSDFVPIFRLFILIDQKIGGKYYDYKVN